MATSNLFSGDKEMPPPYQESQSSSKSPSAGLVETRKVDEKGVQYFRLREEVATSRSRHVADIVARLLPVIQSRARTGLSKSILILLPPDSNGAGQLVGFPEDETPILIQLGSCQDTVEFWSQTEAISELEGKMLAALGDESVLQQTLISPERPAVNSKGSFFGRRQRKEVETKPGAQALDPEVIVKAEMDEVHLRSETEYGLFTTSQGRAVVLTVIVR